MPALEEQEGILAERAAEVVRPKVTYGRASGAADTSIAQSSSPLAIFDANSSPTRTRRSTGESNAADTSYATTAGSDSEDRSPLKQPSMRAARTLARIVSEPVDQDDDDEQESDELEDEEDDEAILERVRRRMQAANAAPSSQADAGSAASGGPVVGISSDLSSVPPTSSLAAAHQNTSSVASKSTKPAHSSSSSLPPIGRIAGRMKPKKGRPVNQFISFESSSAEEEEEDEAEEDVEEEEDDQPTSSPSPRKRKSTGGSNKTVNDTLGSAPTDSHDGSASEDSDIDLSALQTSQHRKAERHSKLGQLAERRKLDQAEAKRKNAAAAAAEAPIELDGDDSSVIASDDDDEELPTPTAALVTAAGDVLAANKQKDAAEAAAKQARRATKAARLSTAAAKARKSKDKSSDKRRSRPKPLTKEELSKMEKETARINRQQLSRKQSEWAAKNHVEAPKYGVMQFMEQLSKSDMVRNVAPRVSAAAPAAARTAAPFAESMEEIAGSSPQVAQHTTSSGFPSFAERGPLSFGSPSTAATSARPTLSAPRAAAPHASSSKAIGHAFADSDEEELPELGDAFAGIIAKRQQADKAKQLAEKKARIVAGMKAAALKAGKKDDDDDLEIMVAPKKPAARPMQMDRPALKPQTPGAKGARRLNHFSSPAGVEDSVTDSQLRVAAFQFAPANTSKVSPRVAQHRFSPSAVEDEAKPKAAAAHGSVRRPNPHVTQNQLNLKLLEQMQVQNLRTREKRLAEGGPRAPQTPAQPDEAPEDLAAKLKKLAETAAQRGARLLGNQNEQDEESEDEEDEAFEPEEGKYDHLELGSGDEAEAQLEEAGSGSEEDEEAGQDAAQEDSDKENSQPVASQASSHARPSQLDDEEEGQVIVPAPARRNRHSRAVLSDDEEDQPLGPAQLGQRTPLRPLRTDSLAAGEDSPPMPPMDDDYDLAPHGEGSSSPGAIAAFGGDGGLTQFFQGTQGAPDEPMRGMSARSLSNVESQGPAASASEPASTFGQFFEGTQVDAPLRGESLDILARTGRVTSIGGADGPAGLSQLFADATPPQTGARQSPSAMPPPLKSAAGAATGPDAFAALRRAQAEELLAPSPSMLPSLSFSGQIDEEHEARLEAAAERMRLEQLAANRKPQQQYLNSKGFFTQTKPGAGDASHDSQSQSQGASWPAYDASPARPPLESSMGADAPHSELGSEVAPSPVVRRPKFRRAVAEASDSEEETDKAQASPSRKRAASVADDEDAQGDEEDEVVPVEKAAPQPPKPANAFSVLMAPKPREQPPRKPTNAFVEGEAEESDEEELALGKRRGHGGLRGVFSDEEEEAEEADEDEEDDGRDLEGLVNDEREKDEAEKDKLAQKAYWEQKELDEEAHLVQAQKIVAGEARNKRARRDGDINGVLDEDFDEEDMLRRAQGPKFKKRKVDGDDKLDALGEKEETKAFFDLYKNTVQTNDETFQHDNLAPDEDSSSDDNGGEEEDDDDLASEGEGAVRKTITQKQIREEIRLARKRKRAAVADDEEEEPRRSQEPEPRKKSWYDDSDAEPDSDDGLPRQLQSRNPLRKAKPKASVAAARTAFRSRGEDSDEDPTLAMTASASMLSRGFASNKSEKNSERLQQFAQEHKDSSSSNARRAASGSSSSVTAMSARQAKAPAASLSRSGSASSLARGPSSMRKSSSSLLAGVKSVMGRRVEESQ